MYTILGKDALEAVNNIAQKAMITIHNTSQLDDSVSELTVSKGDLLALSSGFLYLYNVVLEEGMMPNTRSAKHNIFTLH